MGKIFERIDDELREWIAKQSMFFVATAPRDEAGHVNVSPKGPIGSFRVIDDHTVAYLDVIGSGAETIAHLRENGRIVVMFCAFDGRPRILRLHGRGSVVMGTDLDAMLESHGFEDPGLPKSRRAIIRIDVTRVADACGYGVPLLSLVGRRDHMFDWAEKKSEDDLAAYKKKKNLTSIDGLPALSEDE